MLELGGGHVLELLQLLAGFPLQFRMRLGASGSVCLVLDQVTRLVALIRHADEYESALLLAAEGSPAARRQLLALLLEEAACAPSPCSGCSCSTPQTSPGQLVLALDGLAQAGQGLR